MTNVEAQAAFILAAREGTSFGELTKVQGWYRPNQEFRFGCPEARDLGASAKARGDHDQARIFEWIHAVLMGPHMLAVLSGDGQRVDSNGWCDCPAEYKDTTPFERWSGTGRSAEGRVHTAAECRKPVRSS